MKQVALSSVIVLISASCAHDVATHYPGTTTGATGEIEIALTGSTHNLFVTVDDNTIVRDAHTQNVVIDNVPAGPHRVRVAMGADGFEGKEHEATVNVSPQSRSSLVVAAPNVALSQAVISGAVFIGQTIVIGALMLVIGK